MTANKLVGKYPFLSKSSSSRRWLQVLFVVILTSGIFFRVVNLDKKPIWADETHTFSVISGYSDLEVIEEIPEQISINVQDFLKFQYPNPNKGLSDSLYKLYTDVHPPLYFLFARTFVQWFGDSIRILRLASSVLSILTLPCIYWLCLELFRSSLVGLVATVLFCVSPFQVLYAQEARPYSLFTLVILLSGASLLWSLRTRKRIAWSTYAVSIALGLYSQLFFLFVIFGYFAYMVLLESFQITARLRNFLIATFLGFLAFSPWLITVFLHLSDFKEKSSWISSHTLTFLGAVRLWSENISLSFIDPRASEYLGLGRFGLYFLIPFILVLVLYSLYFLCTNTSRQVYLFVLTLIISTALPLISADLILGGNRQIWPRYLIPCFIGTQISVAYLLTAKIFKLDYVQTHLKYRLWSIVAITLIASGMVFSSIITHADNWWSKYEGGVTIELSTIINQAEDPLVIVNRTYPKSVLYYNLDPQVKLIFVSDLDLRDPIFKTEHEIFLLNPSDVIKDKFNSQVDIDLLAEFPNPGPVGGKSTELWKVVN